MNKMGMTRSSTDPCVFYLKDENGKAKLIIACHVDDTIIVGKKEDQEWFKTEVQKRFSIKDLGKLKKHLGVWYEWKQENGETIIEAKMTALIDEIIKATEKYIGKEIKTYKTPGAPGESLTKS